jgi:hypothetical protein
MPLIHGKKAATKAGFQHNVRAEAKTHPPKQAVAIAYSLAREGRKHSAAGKKSKR